VSAESADRASSLYLPGGDPQTPRSSRLRIVGAGLEDVPGRPTRSYWSPSAQFARRIPGAQLACRRRRPLTARTARPLRPADCARQSTAHAPWRAASSPRTQPTRRRSAPRKQSRSPNAQPSRCALNLLAVDPGCSPQARPTRRRPTRSPHAQPARRGLKPLAVRLTRTPQPKPVNARARVADGAPQLAACPACSPSKCAQAACRAPTLGRVPRFAITARPARSARRASWLGRPGGGCGVCGRRRGKGAAGSGSRRPGPTARC
jgi:hypothetical protein